MFNHLEQFVQGTGLRPGDGIVVKKRFLGLLKHYVIYLGKKGRRHLFIANMTQGVQVLNSGQIGEFLRYMEPKKIIPFEGTDLERREAVKRAFSFPNRQNYNLLANNCEHFFNFTQSGRAYSKQTALFGTGLTVGGLVMAVNKASKNEEDDEYADLKVATGLLIAGLGLFTIGISEQD